MGTGTHHFGSVRQRDQCAVSWLGPGSVCVCVRGGATLEKI